MLEATQLREVRPALEKQTLVTRGFRVLRGVSKFNPCNQPSKHPPLNAWK